MRIGHWIISFVVLGTVTSGAYADHPYLHFHHALWALHEARKELHESKFNAGGHREKAIHEIDKAIKHLDRILKSKEVSTHGTPPRKDLEAKITKGQHFAYVHTACKETQYAHDQIVKAKHLDLGWNRTDALRDMDHAVEEMRMVMKLYEESKNKNKNSHKKDK